MNWYFQQTPQTAIPLSPYNPRKTYEVEKWKSCWHCSEAFINFIKEGKIIVRATTPIITLKIKNDAIDLSQAEAIFVSIVQGKTTIELKEEDLLEVDKNIIKFCLTQEQSLSLNEKIDVEIQVNWTYLDGDNVSRRAATKVKNINIDKQLLRREI